MLSDSLLIIACVLLVILCLLVLALLVRRPAELQRLLLLAEGGASGQRQEAEAHGPRSG